MASPTLLSWSDSEALPVRVHRARRVRWTSSRRSSPAWPRSSRRPPARRRAASRRSSGPRGGLLGTYTAEDWPGAHEVLSDPVFALEVGERTGVLEATYGYVFAERCEVELIHTRHILIRYAGAKKGHGLLKKKRDALKARFQQMLKEIVRSRLGEWSVQGPRAMDARRSLRNWSGLWCCAKRNATQLCESLTLFWYHLTSHLQMLSNGCAS